MKELWNRFLTSLMFNVRHEIGPIQTEKNARYWQITIIASDYELNPKSPGFLSSPIIEHGFKATPLPLFLRLCDVEAIEIGDTPIRINPLPEDLNK